ncbi:MAG TPA: histidine phosphatase family protein [Verrucomicrobiae bacterium]|jgi:broad specificity phosphatase PhoE|nr:histidine phosphatase family protein [Verrucomicrobiae bacterium]
MPGDGQEVYAIRHGETAWSLTGQHTSSTDIPLTENGRAVARRLRPLFTREPFALVLASPRQRARETAEIAGLGDRAAVEPDLREWEYGAYEGLTRAQIRAQRPGWMLFRDGCPGGEGAAEVGARADRVIARIRAAAPGHVAVFAHGHILRVLAARWIDLPASDGEHFVLDTARLSVLGYYHESPAVKVWNADLAGA